MLNLSPTPTTGETEFVPGLIPSFSKELEQQYREDRVLRMIPLQRFSLLLALVLYASFFVLDALYLARMQVWQTYALIFGLAAPPVAYMLWVTWRPRLHAQLQWLPVFVLSTSALALVLGIAIGNARSGHSVPPEILVVQFMYDFFLLGLLFRAALPLTLAIVAGYALTSLAVEMPLGAWVERLYFLLGVAFIGALACRLHEIGDRQRWLTERTLRELSERDALTGLYNRRLFYERGNDALRMARRDRKGIAVLLVDADHFKNYNDTHGHLAGDDALRRVATQLQAAARRPLDIAARLGGEEFVLFIYDVTVEWARERAEQLRSAVATAPASVVNGQTRQLTISIGLTHLQGKPESATLEDLLSIADAALYRAKDGGRNQVRE